MIDESRLEKIEDMVTTLISMVGNLNERLDSSIAVQENFGKEQTLMREELNRLDGKITALEEKVDSKFENIDLKFENIAEKIEKLQENQNSLRSEIMEKLITIQADQDLIWEKSVRNEREIAKMKATLQS